MLPLTSPSLAAPKPSANFSKTKVMPKHPQPYSVGFTRSARLTACLDSLIRPMTSALLPENWTIFRVEFSSVGFLGWARRYGEKASKFTDAQKAFVIKQGEEGTLVAVICRKAGISQATYFNWKKKYAGLLPSEMRRLRELEDENSRLKKNVADLTLDREILQGVIKRSRRRPSEARPTL